MGIYFGAHGILAMSLSRLPLPCLHPSTCITKVPTIRCVHLWLPFRLRSSLDSHLSQFQQSDHNKTIPNITHEEEAEKVIDRVLKFFKKCTRQWDRSKVITQLQIWDLSMATINELLDTPILSSTLVPNHKLPTSILIPSRFIKTPVRTTCHLILNLLQLMPIQTKTSIPKLIITLKTVVPMTPNKSVLASASTLQCLIPTSIPIATRTGGNPCIVDSTVITNDESSLSQPCCPTSC